MHRIIVKPFTASRIMERTVGKDLVKRNFVFAGLGSVGSQLIHFMLAYTEVSFNLIDNDILKVDNIGRHLLGLMYVGNYKTNSIAEHLKSIRPDIMVKTFQEDICDFCESKDFVNILADTTALPVGGIKPMHT